MKKSISRMVVLVLSVVLIFCAVAAYAGEQYKTEISASYNRLDTDQDGRTLAYGVSAEVFFAPVKIAEHPYAEAAFLERIGSAFLSVLNEDVKSGTLTGKGPALTAGLNYTKPGFPFAIQAMYTTMKVDFDAPYGETKNNGYSLRVGNYATNTLLAGVEYNYSKSESSFTGPTYSTKSTGYGLFAKYVHELAHGKELSFEASLGTSKLDDGTETLSNTDLALSVDYYLNRSLSVGVGIVNSSGKDDNDEGRTYSANVRYFITPRFSVQATYDRFLNANADLTNYRTFGATLAARF